MNLKRPSMVKKVAVVGPECTGKSELCKFLASHYGTGWVPEYARGYLENLVRPYEQHDLLTIAHGQIRLEDKYERIAKISCSRHNCTSSKCGVNSNMAIVIRKF